MKLAKRFTLDAEINEYIQATKGARSFSECVNVLLRRAMLAEQHERLETEASAFFADNASDRSETQDFRRAAIRTLVRGCISASKDDLVGKLASVEADARVTAGARSSLLARLKSQSVVKATTGRRRWAREKLYEDK
jgi:hypothetical protein